MDTNELEKYSSAVTLSDMEIFVFPELAYSLVLANIMSPVLWRWRKLDWVKKLEGKSSYRKLIRMKQFIMDQYEFNLDLETWGLTDQKKELKRFENVISPDEVASSNALFGYQGDKYYFDVDIRKHFGLDKYDSDIIPYWKTETIEAMDAFIHKPGYTTGAGECVSLSSLYAAAAFVVCQIPLEDIYMMLTPLHSQNFIDVQDGVLTNNRRIVTKAMWFNGTAITYKAQRAIRNENVTIVAHPSGYIHCIYKDATINKNSYKKFSRKLTKYLTTDLDSLIIANFLRSHDQYQKHFQFCREYRGKKTYIKAEKLFEYEHGSSMRIADDTFDKLFDEVSEEDFSPYNLNDRICCEQLKNFIEYENIDIRQNDGKAKLTEYLKVFIPNAEEFTEHLAGFTYTEAKLPSSEKNYIKAVPFSLSVDMSREEIIEYLQSIRKDNVTADLAFYAAHDMERCQWEPFVKAAMERNPVSIEQTEKMSMDEVYQWLTTMENKSIYEGKRLAQPDEVINYQLADGIEKAFVLANIIRHRNSQQNIKISIDESNVVLQAERDYQFVSSKGLNKTIDMPGGCQVYTC